MRQGSLDLEQEEVVVPFSLSMRQKIAFVLGAFSISVSLGLTHNMARPIASASFPPLIVLKAGTLFGAILLTLVGDPREIRIAGRNLALLLGFGASCLGVATSILLGCQPLVIFFELTGLGCLFLILKKVPGPTLSDSVRREGRYFIMMGAICSLGTMVLCSIGWTLFIGMVKGVFVLWPGFLFRGPWQFVILGTFFGVMYTGIRSKIVLPPVASGLLYGSLIYLVLASLNALHNMFPSWFIISPYYRPSLFLQSIPWLVFGCLLGLSARIGGFTSPREFSMRESGGIYASASLVIALVFLAWAYPAIAGPPAVHFVLTEEDLPSGYDVAETERQNVWERLLTKLQLDLFGEEASIPYVRLRQVFRSTKFSGQSAPEIDLTVRSSTTYRSASYLASRNQTLAERLGWIIVPVPRTGEMQVGWESYPLPTAKRMLFTLNGFLVEVDGHSADWEDILLVAKAAERRLEPDDMASTGR